MQRLERDSNGTQIQLTPGEEFEVALSENPTTGFRWEDPPEGNCVRLVNEAFSPTGPATGAGGMRIWRFQAVREGQISLQFVHKRSWESRSVDSFEVTVRVAPAH